MSKRIKGYKHFINHELMKDVVNMNESIDINYINIYTDEYAMIQSNQLLMMDVIDDMDSDSKIISESTNDVIKRLNSDDFENSPELFYNSYKKSDKIEYLSDYTIDELSKFKLYKVRGYDIGFAIDKGNIILVHNNSKVKHIGNDIMSAVKRMGGTHLDHFDGFLTGFYKRNGFKFRSNLIFDKKYAPNNWEYAPIDIHNENTSIYVNEKIVSEEDFKLAKERYDNGMPDVIYRNI